MNSPTFGKYTAQWHELMLPLVRPATAAAIRSHMKHLEMLANEPINVSRAALQAYINKLSLTLAPKTVHNIYGTLHLILASAARDGLIPIVPEIKLPKVGFIQQDWLTVEQMRKIFEASDRDPFFAVLMETGLRIGEVLALDYADINYAAQTLTIDKSQYNGIVQSPKTRAAYRTLRVSTTLLELLRTSLQEVKHKADFRDRIFSKRGKTLWPDHLASEYVHPLMETLGMKPVGFHAWRRGAATAWVSQLGMPEKIAAYRLGHRCPGLTLGTYAQTFEGIDKGWELKIEKLIYTGE